MRWATQVWHVWERTLPFLRVTFSADGIASPEGRQLIVGKFRRIAISMVPGLAEKLQKKYGIQGGCSGCGASCNLLFRCPHWIESTRRCGVYELRPTVCRQFPVTPADIAERELVRNGKPCGYTFRG
ncbi:YkgJ family cysteine cluster protein [bacterium]|nr:YkgJ family cysteine cluster protein [bacterium]